MVDKKEILNYLERIKGDLLCERSTKLINKKDTFTIEMDIKYLENTIYLVNEKGE